MLLHVKYKKITKLLTNFYPFFTNFFPFCKGRFHKKKSTKKSGDLPNLPRPTPPFGVFTNKKNDPSFSFLRMNHWCTKQILHLVPSKYIFICFCSNCPYDNDCYMIVVREFCVARPDLLYGPLGRGTLVKFLKPWEICLSLYPWELLSLFGPMVTFSYSPTCRAVWALL